MLDEFQLMLQSAVREAVGSEIVRIVPGDRWRNLLVVGEGQADAVRTARPIPGTPLDEHPPTGPGCALLKGVEGRCVEILEEHEINTVRIDLGENPANAVRVWGGGHPEPPSGRLEGIALDRASALAATHLTDENRKLLLLTGSKEARAARPDAADLGKSEAAAFAPL